MQAFGPTVTITANPATSLAAHAPVRKILHAVPAPQGISLSGLVSLANMIAMMVNMVIPRQTCVFCAIILA
jgi:hypothetical protein